MLPEDRRKQLDGIVQQMVQNNESDGNIRFVVDDFKKKYTPQETTKTKAKLPILSKEGGFGTALKDVAVGAGKSFLEGARGTAQLLQGTGQRFLAGITPGQTVEDIKKTTGFKSLDNSTSEGAGVAESLKADSRGEQVGKVLGTAGEIASGFVAAKGPQLVNKARTVLSEAREAKALDKTLEAVTPRTRDLKPTEYEELLKQGKISPKTSKQPARYILSDQEKTTAIKYRSLINKDPVKTSINIVDEIAKKDAEVGEFLRKNNGIFNSGELKNHIIQRLEGITDIAIPEERIAKLKDTMANGFVKALKKNDMESLWQARKAFDRSIEKVFNGSPTLQNQIKREFRNAIQDFIVGKTPEGVYKGKMNEMRELFDLFDTISTKATKERGRNAIQSWIAKNPTKSKIIGGLLGTGIVGVGAKSLLGD